MLLVTLQIPQPKTHNKTLMNRDTNAEREVVFTAYSKQPTQGYRWRQLYHNGLDWNLQIDAVLAFFSKCPRHRNIKPASVVISTAHLTQADASCSGVFFAQPKCYYALMLAAFGLRLNLIQLIPYCYVGILVPSLVTLYGFPFFSSPTCKFYTHVFIYLCFDMSIPC